MPEARSGAKQVFFQWLNAPRDKTRHSVMAEAPEDGASWTLLGRLVDVLERLGRLRALLWRLGGVLGPSWGGLEGVWGGLGALLGRSWETIFYTHRPWGRLGEVWGGLGALLGRSQKVL